MTVIWNDARHVVRSWRKAPSPAILAIATIACGIGALTVVSALVSAVLLKPLPYPDADRLVVLVNTLRGNTVRLPYVSPPRVRAWREHDTGIEDLALYLLGQTVNLSSSAEARQAGGGYVTASFFPLFGARLERGRFFTPEEDVPGHALVAVLSHALWHAQFGGADDVIGRTIAINGEPATIIGVAGASFDAHSLAPGLVNPTEIWLPLRFDPETNDDANNLIAAARLAPDMPLDLARNRARAAAEHFRRLSPTEMQADASFDVTPLADVVVGDVRPSLLTLLAAVALIAVLVSANTANLLLARATARRREFAVRIAVGASRPQLIRQLLTEGLLLAATGSVVGAPTGLALVGALVGRGIVRVPRLDPAVAGGLFDVRLLAVLIASSIGIGLGVGLAPLAASRIDDVRRDLSNGRGVASSRHRRAHAVLLGAEVAIACVVLVGAVLMLRSLVHLQRVNPGFVGTGVWTMQTASGDLRLASAANAVPLFGSGLQRLQEFPEVAAAAVSLTGVPLAQTGALRVDLIGRSTDELFIANWDLVSPLYFEVFGIPLFRGRVFDERDQRETTPVVVINRTMAGQLWPGADPLGQRIVIGRGAGPAFEDPLPREVIGVVGDVRQFGLARPPRPGMYVPLAQVADVQMSFLNRLNAPATWVVRARSSDRVPTAALGRQLLSATGLPAAEARSMDQVFRAAMAAMAQNSWLMAAFGILALLVAVLGVYAIAAYSVQARTHELGIRLAIGAKQSDIRRMIVWDSLRVVVAGTAAGMLAAVALSGTLASLLFGISGLDPITLATVPGLLIAAAAAGVYLPARRASAVDPIEVLRE